MQQIAVLGLGLIGTSIGLGVRRWAAQQPGDSPVQIVGYDADLSRQRQARAMKAIDVEARDLPAAVRAADLVVLAVPVGTMAEVMQDCAPHLKAGATVTDVASTKASVIAWARETLPITVSFVGGHPMAGGTGSIEAARADLFEGARWCVVPAVRADEAAVELVLGLVAALGARSYFVDADEHDGLVAAISHLPFSLAAALTQAVAADPAWREMKVLAAGGFRDTTRLAEGSPIMHRDIAVANAAALTRWLDRMIEELGRTRDLVAAENAEGLLAYFEQAQDQRIRWRVEQEREAAEAAGAPPPMAQVPSLGDSMQQMFFGGLGRRRRDDDKSRKP
jgi:prephenate dehydrogenase